MSAGGVNVSGTQNETANPPSSISMASFSWRQVSSWTVEYSVTSVAGNANFRHDGNGDFTFVAPNTTYLLALDLDANNSTSNTSPTDTNYQTTFNENGAAVHIVDTDIAIMQHAVLGTSLGSATIQLANAQPDDVLLVNGSSATNGTIMVGATSLAYTLTNSGAQIVVEITGAATIAEYQIALQSITFTNPSENPSGVDRQIDISVTNTLLGTTSNQVLSTIHVVPDNDAPVAVDDTKAVIEDTAATGNVITGVPGADSDINSSSLSVTQFTIDTNGDGTPEVFTAGSTATIAGIGTLTIGVTGDYTFSPALNYTGPVPVTTYTLSDGGLTDMATLTFTIMPVNDPPVAIDDDGTATEDTVATGVLLPNDTDVDGGALFVTEFSIAGISGTFVAGQTANIPGAGTLQINPNGTFTFSPVANFAGTIPVASYTISDGRGGTDSGDLRLTMTPVNDPPVAAVDSGSGPEDAPVVIDVLGNDSDIDNALNPSSVVIVTTPAGATLSPDGKTLTVPGQGVWTVNPVSGAITFMPVADYIGTPTPISYRVADADGLLSNAANVSVTITPVNDPPVVDLNSAAVAIDTVRGNATTFSEGDAPLPVAPAADSSDIGENDIASLKVVVGGIKDGALEVISIGGYPFNPIVSSQHDHHDRRYRFPGFLCGR